MTLVYLDECGFSPSLPVNYSWTLASQRKLIPYENPQGRRVNVLAALVPDGPARSLTWSKVPRTITSDDLVMFVSKAIPRGRGLRVVVMDNASFHRSKVVKQARRNLRKQGIVLYYLPPYSPELNDIEAVFGAIKHHDMPERAYTSVDDLTQAIEHAFIKAEERLLFKPAHLVRPAA